MLMALAMLPHIFLLAKQNFQFVYIFFIDNTKQIVKMLIYRPQYHHPLRFPAFLAAL